MEEARRSTQNTPGQTPGLFPPRKASDYPGVVQMWGMTDIWNLTAYEHYAHLLRTLQDPHADQATEAAADYRSVLEAVFYKYAKAQQADDKLILPMDANNVPATEQYLRSTSLADGFFNEVLVIWAGLGDKEPEAVEKLLRYRLETLHYLENGMVFPFERSGASYSGRRWYGNWLEYKLYFYYRRKGEDTKAKELLDAQINYNMTPEFYLSERYDDCDPWYIPWCPNCSAIGRTILMLCDWYH